MEVDAPAQQDLSSVMASIREHYETVASKNRRDVENWFQAKVGNAEEAELIFGEDGTYLQATLISSDNLSALVPLLDR